MGSKVRGADRRVETTGTQLGEKGRGALWEEVALHGIIHVLPEGRPPGRGKAVAVSPAHSLGDQWLIDFVGAGLPQAGSTFRGEGSAVKTMKAYPVCKAQAVFLVGGQSLVDAGRKVRGILGGGVIVAGVRLALISVLLSFV